MWRLITQFCWSKEKGIVKKKQKRKKIESRKAEEQFVEEFALLKESTTRIVFLFSFNSFSWICFQENADLRQNIQRKTDCDFFWHVNDLLSTPPLSLSLFSLCASLNNSSIFFLSFRFLLEILLVIQIFFKNKNERRELKKTRFTKRQLDLFKQIKITKNKFLPDKKNNTKNNNDEKIKYKRR